MKKSSNKKKFTAGGLSAAIIASAILPTVPINVSAEETETLTFQSGIFTFEYKVLEDGTVEITKTSTLETTSATETDLIIPEEINGMKVTSIGKKGAYDIRSNPLRTIILNDSLKSIGQEAFMSATATNIEFNDNLEVLAPRAFASSKIKSLDLPNSLTQIGDNAFYSMQQLENVKLPENMKDIPVGLFNQAKMLSSITLPSGLETIGNNSFQNTILTQIEIPETVTSIGEYAFSGTRLASIKIPSKVEEISKGAFNIGLLKTIEFHENVKTIGESAFAGANLQTLSLPDSVEHIGNGAFSSSLLTELELGPNVKYVGDYAFSKSPITELKLSDSVEYIGEQSFNKSSLKSLEIGPNVKHIGSNALGLDGITSFKIPDNVETIGTHPVRTVAGALMTEIHIGKGVKVIPDNAFKHSATGATTGLTKVYLSEGLEQIGNYAFYQTIVDEITIPSTVKRIGTNAFNQGFNGTLKKATVLSKDVTYTSAHTDTLRLAPDAFIYGYEGSTTEDIYRGKGFIAITEPVEPTNNAPTIEGVIPRQTVEIDKELKLDITNYFKDLDGDNLTYKATVINGLDGDVGIVNGELVFYGYEEGTFNISVIANDGKIDSAPLTVRVVVEAPAVTAPPVDATPEGEKPSPIVNSVIPMFVEEGNSISLNVKDYFNHVDENSIFTLESTVGNYASASIDGSTLIITGDVKGESLIKIKAENQYGVGSDLLIQAKVHKEVQTTPIIKPSTESGVSNITILGKDVERSIPLTTQFVNMDLSKTTFEVINSDDNLISVTFDDSTQDLKVTSKEFGFGTIQVKATDENGNKAAFLLLVDIKETANFGPGAIHNATIRAEEESYVVPLNEVFGSVIPMDNISYTVGVSKKGESVAQTFNMRSLMTVASLDNSFLPVATTLNTPIAGVVLPEGVDTHTVYSDGTLKLQIVNNLLVATGTDLAQYEIEVQAANAGKTLAVPFNLTVLKDPNSGTTPPIDNGGGNTGGTTPPIDNGGGNTGGTTPPVDNGGGNTGGTTPPIDNGGGNTGGTTPPVDNGGNTGGTTPPIDNGGGNTGGTTPPIDNGGGNTGGTTPPVDNGGNTGGTTPPIDNGGNTGGTTPPIDNGGNTGGTTPPVDNGGNTGGTTPPIDNGGNTGGTTPPIDNGGNTGDGAITDKLKDSIDSLIVDINKVDEDSFELNLDGDTEDLNSVDTLIIKEDGIYVTVDEKEVKISEIDKDLSDDLNDKRAIRLTKNSVSSVMHYVEDSELVLTTKNFNDILITSRVAEPFVDVHKQDWFHKDVEDAFNYVFTHGTSATTFDPNAEITRGQFAAMIARAIEITKYDTHESYDLKDVKGKWYADDVQYLVNLGIIHGYEDGTFGGGDTLTRQQAMAILGRTLEHLGVEAVISEKANITDYNEVSLYAKQYVNYFVKNGVLVSGYDIEFNPKENITRSQMAKVLVRALKLTEQY